MRPKMLVFDVGETLVSEERFWTSWAEWLGMPAGTFFAALGAVIERRGDYREVFSDARPGIDLVREREKKAEAGLPPGFLASDLFPDTIPTLQWARAQGYRLGFAGNHSRATEEFLKGLGVEADVIGSAERWGVAKPDPRFFEIIVELSGFDPKGIVYVGDRIDNDVLPAQALGMQAIHVERGPWGVIQARWPEASSVRLKIKTLSDLKAVLGHGG
ncbi:HAD family hydrolase [Microvirga splendida]|uniref:HAD family hydrolase n=1 Tax=Microvirga splendida TaxID=2795727 RepID=A0ABS0XX55_9HYPH|nr:HAD family hydrolase [Microvirga splendida]MBJ6124634.1 HAD family hydrolase [Microvirga splendida]